MAVPETLYDWQGVWLASTPDNPDPDPSPPPWGAGCEIQDGWRLVVELWYDPTLSMRYGGPGDYGEPGATYGGNGVTPRGEQWIDLTRYTTALSLFRGSELPTVNSTVDTITFTLVDPGFTVHDWKPPQSFSSPNVGTPVRIGIQSEDGYYMRLVTARVEALQDVHDVPGRTIQVESSGVQAEANVPLLEPAYGVQDDADVRIQQVLTELNWSYGFVGPLPTTALAADAERRFGPDTYGLNILQECAHSTGSSLRFDRYGRLVLVDILEGTTPADYFTATDCVENSSNPNAVVYTGAVFTSDTDMILNDVLLVHKWTAGDSVQAIDQISVDQFGVHAAGYGFPLNDIVTANKAELQAFADAILARTANIVNRVEAVSFNTLTDARWWNIFPALDLEYGVNVERTEHAEITFTGRISGIELVFETSHVEGTLFISTSDQTG